MCARVECTLTFCLRDNQSMAPCHAACACVAPARRAPPSTQRRTPTHIRPNTTVTHTLDTHTCQTSRLCLYAPACPASCRIERVSTLLHCLVMSEFETYGPLIFFHLRGAARPPFGHPIVPHLVVPACAHDAVPPGRCCAARRRVIAPTTHACRCMHEWFTSRAPRSHQMPSLRAANVGPGRSC